MADVLVYSPGEVAVLLRLNRETVYRWLAAGRMPGLKVGGLWLIPVDSLTTWLLSSSEEERRDGQPIPQEVGRPLGGGDLERPAGQPDDDRALREDAST